jgi:hypothetical protein
MADQMAKFGSEYLLTGLEPALAFQQQLPRKLPWN